MFIAKNNDFIVLAKDTREELEQALQFMVYTSIEETNTDYQLYNGEYLTPAEIKEKETERVGELTMTAQDLLDLISNSGASWDEIDNFLNSNKEFKLRLTTCQNVFCGVVRQLLPIKIGNVTITDDMIVNAFKRKNGEAE